MTEKFRAFLANAMRFEPEEKREQIVADAEGMMTDFIRAKVDPTKDLVPLCANCYANANDESVLANWKRHWLWNAEIHN